MNGLPPRTRSVFDALREGDDVDPEQIDRAWRRFASTEMPASHHVAAKWIAATTATAAIGLALAIAALGSGSEAQSETSGGEPHEASAHIDAEVVTRDVTPRVGRPRVPGSDAETETAPDPRAAPSAVSPEDRDAEPSRPRVRRDRGPSSKLASDPAAPRRSAADPSPLDPSADPSTRPESTLAAELRLLDEAERALREGRLDRVEALLETHRERYPDGLLVRERIKLASELAGDRDRDR